MLPTYLPDLPEAKPVSQPTPTQTQAVWATAILFLVAFWSGAGLAVNALWSTFA